MDGEIRILLLEDSPADAEMTERLLRRAGMAFTMKRVATESAFRGELVAGTYDVILADFSLPGFDGATALQMARALKPDLPFIFVSGSIGEDRAISLLRNGATDYIIKDRPTRLPSAIQRALDEKDEERRRNRMQAALIRSEQRFHYAAQASQDIIWDWNLATDRLWMSDSVATAWGYPIEDEVNLTWSFERVHPDDLDRVSSTLQKALESETRWEQEFRFRHADGTYRHALNRGIIMRDTEGKPIRMIGAMQDITSIIERRRLEQKLLQAERIASLGRVAATIAHEFNNVLMGIQPFAEAIRRRAGSDERVSQSVSQILNSVSRGRRITEDILRTTKLGSPTLETIDVTACLRLLEPELRAIADRLTVEVAVPDTPLYVRADRAQLQQVLMNLAVNARDAMPSGGTLTVAAGVESPHVDEVHIRVTDTGCGIDPALIEHIFEPLFTTKRSGTGLGLAVAQQLVSANGGQISVRSVVNEGTTFEIILPRAQKPAVDDAHSHIHRQTG